MKIYCEFFLCAILQLTQGDGGTVQAVQTIDGDHQSMTVDLAEATIGQDGQIIITGEDGQNTFHVSQFGDLTQSKTKILILNHLYSSIYP